MADQKNDKETDDYYVNFKGARLTPLESNRVGVGIIFGIIGIGVSFVLPIEAKSAFNYIIIVSFFLVGFFVIAPWIFSNEKKE